MGLKSAFEGLQAFLRGVFLYTYCVMFHGRQCEGYMFMYDIVHFFFRSLSRDKNVYASVYDRSTMADSTL